MNEDKFLDCLDQYLSHCQNSSWATNECYKFFFANWLSRKVVLNVQNDKKVFELCYQALKNDYSLPTQNISRSGVQFLQKSGREKLSKPITLADVEIIRYLADHEIPDEEYFRKRGTSYPALSGWLGTLLPNKFMPIVMTDFTESISYLFDLQDFPRSGYRFFIETQYYFQQIKQQLKGYELESLYLKPINEYLKKEYPKSGKSKYQEVDWNWVTQDFNLFIVRKYLSDRPFKKSLRLEAHTNIGPNTEEKGEPLPPKDVTEFPILSIYAPSPLNNRNGTVDIDNRLLEFTTQDFLTKYQNQILKGAKAEEIVFQDEKDFLNKCGKTELADKVQIVSSNPDWGFDIRSYEANGVEKQIEVKSISTENPKSFFISEHEKRKSTELENYYIYCVLMNTGQNPIIYRLKNPQLDNNDFFLVTNVSYKVSFLRSASTFARQT